MKLRNVRRVMTVLLVASSLITPSVLLDRACRLILLSKLSIDFDPLRAPGFRNRAAE
jgi:hypothetical protein